MPHNNQVTLRVYNVLGQEVETLVNETKAAGTHSVSWDAGGLASGVYLHRIEAGDWSEPRSR